MINKNIPSSVFAGIIGIALVVVGGLEWSALNAKDRHDHPLITMSKAKCLSCHSDARMIAKMKEKEGDSTHSLFADEINTAHADNGSAHPRLPTTGIK